jgi:hypothetical protein
MAVRDTARIKSLVLVSPAGVAAPGVQPADIFLMAPEELIRNLVVDEKLVQARRSAPVDVDESLKNRHTTAPEPASDRGSREAFARSAGPAESVTPAPNAAPTRGNEAVPAPSNPNRSEPHGAAPEPAGSAPARSPAVTAPAPAGPHAQGPAMTAPAPLASAPAQSAAPRRRLPAAVRREVWQRDGARCTFVDERGVRCRATAALEFHHEHAHALGGPSTAANLTLRCRAHNRLAAEHDFGVEHVAARVAHARGPSGATP